MMKKYDVIEFSEDMVDGKKIIHCTNRQLVRKFVVSNYFAISNTWEIQPLTLSRLVRSIAFNFVQMNYWRFMRLMNRVGILRTPEGHIMSWKDLWFRKCP